MSEPIPATLPDKPSDLIRQGLADLEKVEKDPRYIVDMGAWHDPRPHSEVGACAVSFAGAVIARLVNDPSQRLMPQDFTVDIGRKLASLDYFGLGQVRAGLVEFGADRDAAGKLAPVYDVPNYNDNPGGFKVAMREIAAHLATVGL
jgi:hypothetical protein